MTEHTKKINLENVKNTKYYKTSKRLQLYQVHSGRKKSNNLIEAFEQFSVSSIGKKTLKKNGLAALDIPSKPDISSIRKYTSHSRNPQRVPAKKKWKYVKVFLDFVDEKFGIEQQLSFEDDSYDEQRIRLEPGVYTFNHLSTLHPQLINVSKLVISKLVDLTKKNVLKEVRVRWVYQIVKEAKKGNTSIVTVQKGRIVERMDNYVFIGESTHTRKFDGDEDTSRNIDLIVFPAPLFSVEDTLKGENSVEKLGGLVMGVARGHGDIPYAAKVYIEYYGKHGRDDDEVFNKMLEYREYNKNKDELLDNAIDDEWGILI